MSLARLDTSVLANVSVSEKNVLTLITEYDAGGVAGLSSTSDVVDQLSRSGQRPASDAGKSRDPDHPRRRLPAPAPAGARRHA